MIVADHVTPLAAAVPPAGLVDQHGHRPIVARTEQTRRVRPWPRQLRPHDYGPIGRRSFLEVRPREACLDGLLARYREPHRRYHGVAHLDRVVTDVAELLSGVAVTDPSVVRAAAFFHDAIYNPRSTSNETDSAALANRELTLLGWSPERIDEVERLILLTRDHALGDGPDPGGDVLVDADLAVLGAPPNVYQAYVSGVRAEYSHVSDEAWRAGRAQVLQHFIDQPRLYRTAAMSVHERRARSNLGAELATLRRDTPSDERYLVAGAAAAATARWHRRSRARGTFRRPSTG